MECQKNGSEENISFKNLFLIDWLKRVEILLFYDLEGLVLGWGIYIDEVHSWRGCGKVDLGGCCSGIE